MPLRPGLWRSDCRRSRAPSARRPRCAGRRSVPWPDGGSSSPTKCSGSEELIGAHLRRRQEREPIGELRVVEQRLGRVDRRDRRVDRTTELEPLLAVFVRKMSRSSRRSSRLPRAWSAYLDPGQRSKRSRRLDALAEVLPEGLLRGHEEDVAPVGRLVDLVAHALDHAGGARGTAFVVVGLVAGDLGLGPFVGAPGLGAVPVHGRGRIGLGQVDVGAFAGLAGPDHRGQDAERAEERARR